MLNDNWQRVLIKSIGEYVELNVGELSGVTVVDNGHEVGITNDDDVFVCIDPAGRKYPQLDDAVLVFMPGCGVECICYYSEDVVWAVNAFIGSCVARTPQNGDSDV